MIGTGEVISIKDEYDGERIKVRLRPADNDLSDDELAYAYPLLPKMLHIKPKVGEAVLVLFDDDKKRNSQRYYLGPLISQPQFMEKEGYAFGATTLLRGGPAPAVTPIVNNNKGAFPKDNDIAILGRKNCDIILTDNDIRMRCGVHDMESQSVTFNVLNPAFLKLKYYPRGLVHTKNTVIQTNANMSTATTGTTNETIGSVATLVADKINLISTNGDPHIKINDVNESLSDSEMLKILDKAHQLPYGDKLCELLSDFLVVFKQHTHNYNNLPIVNDDRVKAFDKKYGITQQQIGEVILSDSVRIN